MQEGAFDLEDNSGNLEIASCQVASESGDIESQLRLLNPLQVGGRRRFLCLAPSQDQPGNLALEQRECSLGSALDVMEDGSDDVNFELLQCVSAGASAALSVPGEGLPMTLRRCRQQQTNEEEGKTPIAAPANGEPR